VLLVGIGGTTRKSGPLSFTAARLKGRVAFANPAPPELPRSSSAGV